MGDTREKNQPKARNSWPETTGKQSQKAFWLGTKNRKNRSLGWLGDIIIVFIIVIERVRYSGLVWVCLMFFEVGFDSPTMLVSGDPLVYW